VTTRFLVDDISSADMYVKLCAIFLFIELARSRNNAPVQSLYRVKDGYSTFNVRHVDYLSGQYQSLIHCTLACTRSPDCSAISYQGTRYQNDIYCKMFYVRPNSVTFMKEKKGVIYLQDVMSKCCPSRLFQRTAAVTATSVVFTFTVPFLFGLDHSGLRLTVNLDFQTIRSSKYS